MAVKDYSSFYDPSRDYNTKIPYSMVRSANQLKVSKSSDSEASENLTSRSGRFKRVAYWLAYLVETADWSFKVRGSSRSTGELKEFDMPYVHRWHPIYKRRILAKFYQLDKYLLSKYKDGRVPCTLITLTIQQKLDYSDYDKCFEELLTSFAKFRKILYYYYGSQDWFRVIEDHKTGYPHIHMAYFFEIPESDYPILKQLWAIKYGLSDFPDIALNFKLSSEYDNSKRLSSVKNYLISYLTKTFNPSNMSFNSKLFQSTLWKCGYRTWTASKNLSMAMKKPLVDSDFEPSEMYLSYSLDDTDPKLLWDKEHGKHARTIVRTPKLVHIYNFVAEICDGCLLPHHKEKYHTELVDYGFYKKWRLSTHCTKFVFD